MLKTVSAMPPSSPGRQLFYTDAQHNNSSSARHTLAGYADTRSCTSEPLEELVLPARDLSEHGALSEDWTSYFSYGFEHSSSNKGDAAQDSSLRSNPTNGKALNSDRYAEEGSTSTEQMSAPISPSS